MFVVLAMFILGVLIFINSEGWSSQYIVYLKPEKAPGVKVGTPIRKNGILIGRVKKVTMQDEGVLLTLGINEDEKLYANEIASIGNESFLGDAGIEFLTMPVAERGGVVADGHNVAKVELKLNPLEIVNIVADLQKPLNDALVSINQGGLAVRDAGESIEKLSGSIQGVFDDEDSEVKAVLTDFRETAVKAQAALDNFNRIFENVNNVIGDPELKGQIKGALAEVPRMFEEMRVTIQGVNETVQAFGTIPENINATTENLREFSEALKQDGPKVLMQVNSSLQGIDELVMDVRSFTKTLSTLKNSDSSIAKLFNDTELFDTIKETIYRAKESSKNVQRLTTKLEPLVDDFRGFGDQINRNPGVLISGAFEARKAKNNYKGSAGKATFFSR